MPSTRCQRDRRSPTASVYFTSKLEQVLDLTIAVAKVGGDARHVEPILQAALDGLRPTAA